MERLGIMARVMFFAIIFSVTFLSFAQQPRELSFTDQSYVNDVAIRLQREWRKEIRRNSLTLPQDVQAVFFSFTIMRNGSVPASSIRITESSGSSEIDDLAVRCITLAAPFEELPSDYPANQLEFDFTFRFK